MINVADATRHSEHVGRSAQGTYPQVSHCALHQEWFAATGHHAAVLFPDRAGNWRLNHHSVLSLHRLTVPTYWKRCSYSSIVFWNSSSREFSFSPGTSMALTMGVAPTLFIKLNMRIIWVTLLCAWREGKWRCRSDSVQNTSYSGEGRDWMRKTRGSFESWVWEAFQRLPYLISLYPEVERCKINQNTIITVCRIIPFCRSEMWSWSQFWRWSEIRITSERV